MELAGTVGGVTRAIKGGLVGLILAIPIGFFSIFYRNTKGEVPSVLETKKYIWKMKIDDFDKVNKGKK